MLDSFKPNTLYTLSLIKQRFGVAFDQEYSFSLIDFSIRKTSCFLLKTENNVLLSKDSDFHFVCVGEVGNQQIDIVENSLNERKKVFVRESDNVSDDPQFMNWGERRISRISMDPKTVGIFRFLTKTVAKKPVNSTHNAGQPFMEQDLRSIILLTKPEFNFKPQKNYIDRNLGLKLALDEPNSFRVELIGSLDFREEELYSI